MKTKLMLCFAFLTLSVASCSDDDSSPTPQPADNFEPVQIMPTLIGKGFLGGMGEEGISAGNRVIQNTDDWQALVNKMDTFYEESGTFTQTDINFSENMVIAVFTEVKSHGSSIKIDSIVEYDQDIKVFVADPVPEITEIFSQPYYIVKIPSSQKPVVFE